MNHYLSCGCHLKIFLLYPHSLMTLPNRIENSAALDSTGTLNFVRVQPLKFCNRGNYSFNSYDKYKIGTTIN